MRPEWVPTRCDIGVTKCDIMPTYNLIQKRHDKICDEFINGSISYYDFMNYEYHYEKTKHLFTINLN